MKKMTRKTAVMLASAMMASAMMGAGVFADATSISTENGQEGGDSKTADVTLQIGVSDTQNEVVTGARDPDQDDTQYHIWNVTIDTNSLAWNVVKTTTTTKSQTLTWNPSTHTYTAGQGGILNTVNSFSLADGENAQKGFNITNDSNFAVSAAIAVSELDGFSDNSDLFTVTSPNDAIAIGAYATCGITLNPGNIKSAAELGESLTTVGTARITLTASGAIQNYTNP